MRAQASNIVTALAAALTLGCGGDYNLSRDKEANQVSPDITVTPAELFFVGDEGDTVAQQLQVGNQGNAGLKLEQIELSGSGAAAFTILSTLPILIDPGEEVSVDIAWSPINDNDEAVAGLLSDDPDTPRFNVPLLGSWAIPRLEIDPPDHDFGDLPLHCQDQIDLTLSSVGTGVVNIDQILLSGEGYELEGDPDLPLALEPGESVSLTVHFSPDLLGAAVGTLYVNSDDPMGITRATFTGNSTSDGICLSVAEGQQVPLDLSFPVSYQVGDIAFVLDTTSSMGGLAQAMAGEFATIASEVSSRVPDVTFGVATYQDYRYSDYGYGSDRPFNLDHQQTSDLSAVQQALDAITIKNGADGTEATHEALFQALMGLGFDQDCDGTFDSNADIHPFVSQAGDAFNGAEAGTYDEDIEGTGPLGGMGFRKGVLPIVIYATDNLMRDPDVGDGTPGGCPFDAGHSLVTAAAASLGARLIGVAVNLDTSSAPYAQMVDLAAATGSTADLDGDGSADPAVVTWTGSSSEFRDTVVDAVEGLVQSEHFDEVCLVVASDPHEMVTSIEPECWQDVDSGEVVDFTLEFVGSVTSGAEDQAVPVVLELRADGDKLLDSFIVHVIVPGGG